MRLERVFRCARVTCYRHARLRVPNDFLMKVKRMQLTGNETPRKIARTGSETYNIKNKHSSLSQKHILILHHFEAIGNSRNPFETP